MSFDNIPSSRPTTKIIVWDVPVRVFHWLLVLCFAGAWLTAESERWRQIHVTLGYTMAGLIAFRLIWGVVGTPFARFKNFLRGSSAVWAYVKSLPNGKPQHYIGHNPAGALAIVGLLVLIALVAASGWAAMNDIGGNWVEEAHEVSSNALLMLVIVHVVGVIVSSVVHRENLIRSMLTGRKHPVSDAEDANVTVLQRAATARRGSGAILGAVIVAVVLGFWAWQWQSSVASTTNADTVHTNSTEKQN
ncbi:MAG: cytochrome b/b6 domain-containing protein [Casimicrobium sp.]